MIQDRVSVITLAYNNYENYIDCLRSILEQDYYDIELILCDDNSDVDRCKEVETFIRENKKDNLSTFLIKKNSRNLGVVKNYKKAIDMSQGEYIVYLSLDDLFYDSKVISKAIAFMKENNFRICTGKREVIFDYGRKVILPTKFEQNLLESSSLDKILSRDIRTPMIIGACTYFKRELVKEYGFVEEGYVHLEDWPRYIHLMEQGERIGFMDEILIQYRTGGLTSKIKNPDLISDLKKLFDRYLYEPYSNIMNAMKTSKFIIGWGSSGGFEQCHEQWKKFSKRKLDYLVDGNPKKWGTLVQEMKINSPEIIENFDLAEIYIVVFSQAYYPQIAEELESMGLTEGKHFDLISNARLAGRV